MLDVQKRTCRANFSFVFAGLAVSCLFSLGLLEPERRARAADLPQPTISAEIPKDVDIPAGTTGNPIAFFDDFSWRMFVALNWPATQDRGVPDRSKKFGADGPTVWETWKTDYEIHQPNAQRPTVWSSYDAISPCSSMPVSDAALNKVFAGGSLSGSAAIADYNQADFGVPRGCLVAQNRTYVRYEIHVNQIEFDFIRGPDGDQSKWFYIIDNLPSQMQPTLVLPAGSIEIKASWKEFNLPAEQELAKRFHTRKATLVDPQGNCRHDVVMGLIGLHIVHKTPSRREWIWTSFEHVYNLTPAVIGDPAAPPALVNRLLTPPISANNPPSLNPRAVPAKRLRDIHASTKQTNDLYRNATAIKGTVWENYQLVLTQWPTQPAPDDATFQQHFANPNYPVTAGSPFPSDADAMATSFANVTMETSNDFQRGVSCMNCHFTNQFGFPSTEFVWFLRTCGTGKTKFGGFVAEGVAPE